VSKGPDTRRAILDQALRLASTGGLGQLSIGLLAGAAKMSKSGLFAHFRSKEQLQLEVLRAASDRFVAKVLAPALRAPRGEPRLRALVDNWLVWDRDEFPGGCVFQAAAAELDDQPGPVRETLVETQRDLQESIAQIVRAGIESRKFRSGVDPDQVAFEVVGILLAFHRMSRLLRDEGAERRARRSFDDLLARIRA
jgi:AcrR family transcriptional regulator